MASIFVSYTHADHGDGQVDGFLERFERLCRIARPDTHDLWLDRAILPGERWREMIEAALDEANYGLLLLTPAFLASEFVMREELPRFVAEPGSPRTGKRAVPVLLRPVPSSVVETAGLYEHQVFSSNGRAFNELRGTGSRDRFVNTLFEHLQSIDGKANTDAGA